MNLRQVIRPKDESTTYPTMRFRFEAKLMGNMGETLRDGDDEDDEKIMEEELEMVSRLGQEAAQGDEQA